VDVAKLKAEFLQHYYDANGVPFRSRLIAGFSKISALGTIWPGAYNFFVTNSFTSGLIKKFAGFAPNRSMPTMYKTTLKKWWNNNKTVINSGAKKKKVFLFCDEFTNFNDTSIGITAISLLSKLGYEVEMPEHLESGRACLSKGLLRQAKKIANKNVASLYPLINADSPLIGIEPSAILTFRDEYIDLADDDMLDKAKSLSKHVFTIEEFLASEIAKGNLDKNLFTKEKKKILLHGHCQQKSLSSTSYTSTLLSFPDNYSVETLPSGCCGMAGSFGYEKEHFELSQQVGELVLFPAVRSAAADTIIAAPGTSCRHQVKDGTGRKAKHPVEVLFEAMVN